MVNNFRKLESMFHEEGYVSPLIKVVGLTRMDSEGHYRWPLFILALTIYLCQLTWESTWIVVSGKWPAWVASLEAFGCSFIPMWVRSNYFYECLDVHVCWCVGPRAAISVTIGYCHLNMLDVGMEIPLLIFTMLWKGTDMRKSVGVLMDRAGPIPARHFGPGLVLWI